MTYQVSLLDSSVPVKLLGLHCLDSIQAGTAVALNASLCAPGYAVHSKHSVLIVQLAPAYFLHDIAHHLLTNFPNMEPGMIQADGEVGQLVIHSPDMADIEQAKANILALCQLDEAPNNPLDITSLGVLGALTDRHISLLNRGRNGALAVAGDHLLRLQVKPAMQTFSLLERLASVDSQVKLMDARLTPQAGQISLVGNQQQLLQIAKDVTV